jgi:hypothetical protein
VRQPSAEKYVGHLQPIPDGSLEFRLLPADGAYLDPYEWACVIRKHSDGTHEMSLVDKPLPDPSSWKAIVRTLHLAGIKQLTVMRHGRLRTIDIAKHARQLTRTEN